MKQEFIVMLTVDSLKTKTTFFSIFTSCHSIMPRLFCISQLKPPHFMSFWTSFMDLEFKCSKNIVSTTLKLFKTQLSLNYSTISQDHISASIAV